MRPEEIWVPFSWYCSNCGAIVTGYKNQNNDIKVQCSRCQVVQEAVLALHKAKQSCSVSATDYATRIQAYSQRMQELEAQQEEQKSVATRYAEVKAWLDAFEKHISDGTIMAADDSTILKQLVEQIIVGDDGIEVHFKCGIVASHKYM